MTLAFLASTDPIKVEHLIVTITSAPGIGKTSLASTADCILIDADNGQKRTPYRADALRPTTWADCLEVHDHPKVKAASVVVVDTIGRVTDLCAQAIIAENGKGTVYHGALSLQGYGILKSRMIPWIQRFSGKDIVLLSHQREEKKRDELVVRPDIVGGTLQEVLRSSDLIGYLTLDGGKRMLDFEPQEDRLGKNAGRLPVMTVPDLSKGKSTFLADLLAQAKAAMTTASVESLAAEAEVADWQAKMEEVSTALEAMEVLTSIQSLADGPVKAQAKTLLLKRTKEKGLTYDTKAKEFRVSA